MVSAAERTAGSNRFGRELTWGSRGSDRAGRRAWAGGRARACLVGVGREGVTLSFPPLSHGRPSHPNSLGSEGGGVSQTVARTAGGGVLGLTFDPALPAAFLANRRRVVAIASDGWAERAKPREVRWFSRRI